MKIYINVLFLLLVSIQIFAQGPPPPNLTPLLPPTDPIGNISTPDKILLGKILYWDEQLSSTKTVACASCHILSSGGTDPRSSENNVLAFNPGFDNSFNTADDILGSPGVPESCEKGDYILNNSYGYQAQVTGRKSPSTINAGYSSTLFWDGRAEDSLVDPITNELVLASGAALESQALGPPTSSVEMAHTNRSWKDIIDTIEKSSPLALSPVATNEISDWVGSDSYFQLFERVFGDATITASRIAMAIASYERSLYSNQTPFDDFIAGNAAALTAQERRGLAVFNGEGCAACHTGALLTDHDFHNIGVSPNEEDIGRFFVTNNNADRGRFKTPSLRNLENKTSFMHNGGFSTIEQVIDFYDRGGDVNNPNLDIRIVPLNLNQNQKDELAAFLKRPMNDTRVTNETGPFIRPLLYTESNRIPVISGTGIIGSDNKTPILTAIEPPILGNSSFTIGIQNAKADSSSFLVVKTQDPGTDALPEEINSLLYKTLTLNNNNNDGHGSINLQLPNQTAMQGITLFARWYIEDNEAVNGYAISPLVQFTLFKPEFGTTGKMFDGGFEDLVINCN
jgi:cytochrome c peroxidase